ncbi:MAG: SAM-dependent methyltransferase [Dehalococcoidia bacterium]|jgi:SAM-dependent MidA family methyltransferase|nr:SAM-dependent methyltransferase [Dehalococcoidia bacterium]MDP7511882.1 SAM-dependent methyltransferase [Dehalococcoidia bacterium]HJN87558.1 SAM-dependent methyltransferase [Dehalococcoidia bacterium]
MKAEEEIRRRIREQGAISFAEFMGLALFWPEGGYYTGGEPVGASGDFYTSPLVHPAFGALLALQLLQMWQLLDRPDPFTVVEMGAGDGLLGRDVADCSANLPSEFGRSIRYICLDRRAVEGVEKILPGDRYPIGVDRVVASGLPFHGMRGCVLSNEFLDSAPVHQVTMLRGVLREVYVTLKDGELTPDLREPSTPALSARLEDLGIDLTEGQTAEINLGLSGWAGEVAAALEAGFALTIDYGQPAEELYSAERRRRGTLTTYYRHTQTDAPFRNVGRQDMTAQVDFTSVIQAGRRAGLTPLGFTLQRKFLSNLGLGHLQRQLGSLGLAQAAIQANRAGMLDLARPGGFGDFKVLAQGKGVGQPALWGFAPGPAAAALAGELPVPLLTSQHISLPEGRYIETAVEFEEWWPSPEGTPGPAGP